LTICLAKAKTGQALAPTNVFLVLHPGFNRLIPGYLRWHPAYELPCDILDLEEDMSMCRVKDILWPTDLNLGIRDEYFLP
jgi:hypothetical protein